MKHDEDDRKAAETEEALLGQQIIQWSGAVTCEAGDKIEIAGNSITVHDAGVYHLDFKMTIMR